MRASYRIAFDETARHPVRTVLVAQGMIWAVALAVMPAAVLDGSRRQAVERARELRTDRIQVSADASLGEHAFPREDDLTPLVAGLGEGFSVSALRVERARWDGKAGGDVWLLGTDRSLLEARGIRLLAGRLPALEAVPGDELGVVVESHLAQRIFPSGGAIGSTLSLKRTPGRLATVCATSGGPGSLRLRIEGVVEDEAETDTDRFGYEGGRVFTRLARNLLRNLGMAPPDTPWLDSGMGVYLPRALLAGDDLAWIFVRGDPERLEEAAAAIEAALVQRGRTPLIYTNALLPILTNPELDSYRKLHRVLFWLFLAIGLAVLANLLLLAGWRRRREVALRRAEGARRVDIFAQFVWEGGVIAVAGLLIGFPLGLGIAWVRVSLDPNVVMTVGWPWGVGLRSGAALAAGALFASAYPAWRASRHHPMTLFRRGG